MTSPDCGVGEYFASHIKLNRPNVKVPFKDNSVQDIPCFVVFVFFDIVFVFQYCKKSLKPDTQLIVAFCPFLLSAPIMVIIQKR